MLFDPKVWDAFHASQNFPTKGLSRSAELIDLIKTRVWELEKK